MTNPLQQAAEQSDVGQIRENLVASVPMAQRCGLLITEMERGHAACRMPLAGNGNHIGTMYAGALFTLAEMPGGVLTVSSFDITRYVPIVKSLEIKFRALATTDIDVHVRLDEDEIARIGAEAAENGKADFVLDAELTDATGKVVATSHGIYQLRAIPTG